MLQLFNLNDELANPNIGVYKSKSPYKGPTAPPSWLRIS